MPKLELKDQLAIIKSLATSKELVALDRIASSDLDVNCYAAKQLCALLSVDESLAYHRKCAANPRVWCLCTYQLGELPKEKVVAYFLSEFPKYHSVQKAQVYDLFTLKGWSGLDHFASKDATSDEAVSYPNSIFPDQRLSSFAKRYIDVVSTTAPLTSSETVGKRSPR